jgi:hypothetical protein
MLILRSPLFRYRLPETQAGEVLFSPSPLNRNSTGSTSSTTTVDNGTPAAVGISEGVQVSLNFTGEIHIPVQ